MGFIRRTGERGKGTGARIKNSCRLIYGLERVVGTYRRGPLNKFYIIIMRSSLHRVPRRATYALFTILFSHANVSWGTCCSLAANAFLPENEPPIFALLLPPTSLLFGARYTVFQMLPCYLERFAGLTS